MTPRAVFAFSGAPGAWAPIAAAAAARGAEIVTLTLDLGQGADLEEVRDAALAAGAVRAHVLDVRDEFARDYVLPALHARTLQHDPMALSLAAQLASRKLEEVAAIEGAAPVADSIAVRDTLLGRQGARYILTTAPAEAPSTPARVDIAFEAGVPVAINRVEMGLTELIESLAIIAGHHGVGRLEPDPGSRIPGPGVLEAPAALVLIAAHAALADACRSSTPTGTARMDFLKGACNVNAVVRPS